MGARLCVCECVCVRGKYTEIQKIQSLQSKILLNVLPKLNALVFLNLHQCVRAIQ